MERRHGRTVAISSRLPFWIWSNENVIVMTRIATKYTARRNDTPVYAQDSLFESGSGPGAVPGDTPANLRVVPKRHEELDGDQDDKDGPSNDA